MWLFKHHKAILPYLQVVLNNSAIFSKLQTAVLGLITERVGGLIGSQHIGVPSLKT